MKKTGLRLSSAVAVWTLLVILALPAFAQEKLVILVRNQPHDINLDMVREFEEQYGIEVELVRAHWNEMDSSLFMRIAANLQVDLIFEMSVYEWAAYANKGLFQDLTPFLEKDPFDTSDLLPLWDGMWIGEGLYGVAINTTLGATVQYNATLFEEAGLPMPPLDFHDTSWNWETFIDYGKKLTRQNADGYYTQFGIHSVDYESAVMNYPGATFFTAEPYGEAIKIVFDTPANREVFDMITSLRRELQISPSLGVNHTGPRSLAWDPWRDSGQIGMTAVPANLQAFSTTHQWGLAPFPHMGPTREPTVAWVNWVAMLAEPIAKNQEAAWQFIKFMMETEHEVRPGLPGVRQSNWLRHLEEIVNSGLYHHSYNELAEFVAICLNQFTIPTPRYYVPGYGDAVRIMDQIRDQISAGELSVAEGLQQAELQMNLIVQDYIDSL
mgnify:CR=1 FL=1